MAKRRRSIKLFEGMKVVFLYRGEKSLGNIVAVHNNRKKATIRTPRGRLTLSFDKITPISIDKTLEKIREND